MMVMVKRAAGQRAPWEGSSETNSSDSLTVSKRKKRTLLGASSRTLRKSQGFLRALSRSDSSGVRFFVYSFPHILYLISCQICGIIRGYFHPEKRICLPCLPCTVRQLLLGLSRRARQRNQIEKTPAGRCKHPYPRACYCKQTISSRSMADRKGKSVYEN